MRLSGCFFLKHGVVTVVLRDIYTFSLLNSLVLFAGEIRELLCAVHKIVGALYIDSNSLRSADAYSRRADATKLAAFCAPSQVGLLSTLAKANCLEIAQPLVCLLCLGLARNSSHSESERGRAWRGGPVRVSQPAATLPRPVPPRV